LFNISPFDVADVTIKAELQTSTNKFVLLNVDAGKIPGTGSEGEQYLNHDYIVHHEIKEIGIHM
jgi:hypothetical protein